MSCPGSYGLTERPTRTTPFTLTYGMEAIIPTEIGMPIARMVVQGQRYED